MPFFSLVWVIILKKGTTFGKHVEGIKYVSYLSTTVVRNILYFNQQASLSKYMGVVFNMRAEKRKQVFTQNFVHTLWFKKLECAKNFGKMA
jgi:hypothetical protein